MTNSEINQEIAETILRQLGGNKFVVMVGPKQMAHGDRSLMFKIGKNSSKANQVTIRLEENDTYSVTFHSFRKMELKDLKKYENVYDDMLVNIFETYTGLATSL